MRFRAIDIRQRGAGSRQVQRNTTADSRQGHGTRSVAGSRAPGCRGRRLQLRGPRGPSHLLAP
jgi:hypothetical protein